MDEIKAGQKIIFLKGVCGTGKSAIALNLAKHFPKTSIVVPINLPPIFILRDIVFTNLSNSTSFSKKKVSEKNDATISVF